MNEDTSTVNLSPRSKDQKEQVNYQGNTWIQHIRHKFSALSGRISEYLHEEN